MSISASQQSSLYCQSRYQSIRRFSTEVSVGEVKVGGNNPIVVQSMTTTPTQDVKATVNQCIALAEVGCEVIRITAQNLAAAEALKSIRSEFSAAGFSKVPLVADIHFLPKAAMEAAKHVEKVRINPGNYVDKKKFQVKEYSDSQYTEELEKLHEAFSPIVLRCKEYGRAMRIGTNHGSLSDRIMNRYGDTPLGMCESALEFLRIAESHQFHNIVLSMKASNPRVMIQAYRLMVKMMAEEGMHYPLHLGVTEAGDGDDARIKSAIGIGSLLVDGLGDTVRVSLTEDPIAEIPVAQQIAQKAQRLWKQSAQSINLAPDSTDFYHYERQQVSVVELDNELKLGPLESPIVLHSIDLPPSDQLPEWRSQFAFFQRKLKDAKVEGLVLKLPQNSQQLPIDFRESLKPLIKTVIWDLTNLDLKELASLQNQTLSGDSWLVDSAILQSEHFDSLRQRLPKGAKWVLALTPESVQLVSDFLQAERHQIALITLEKRSDSFHAVGNYRFLIESLKEIGIELPLWIRNRKSDAIDPSDDSFGGRLLEASILSGSLLSDGYGNAISTEEFAYPNQSVPLAYNILQGSRARTIKTEYVACPSCGRTLFDLQTTTQKIREATGHLNGVTIAVMGCIVNGPGEMADADFGYVGGAPGKINLYVGKECVQYHIPSDDAVTALIDLIKSHGKWTDPKPEEPP